MSVGGGGKIPESQQREVSNIVKKRILLSVLFLLLVAALTACGSVNISLDSASDASYVFDIVYDGNEGNAYSESKDGYYRHGDTITAHAVGTDSTDFMCWSVGGYLADGGVDISHNPDYTFEITADTWLYANFKPADQAIVYYHTNGGTVCETGEELYRQDFSLAYYLYPNALAELGYFEREGYTLIEYNTAPDGSGEPINLGGKVFVDTNRIIDLYCIWSKQSDTDLFTYQFNNYYQGWYITGYSGHEKELSLPSEYDGYPVIGLAEGALSGADMETLVIPAGYLVIQDFSVSDCENLKKLYLYDSLGYITDEGFDGCSISTYCFNAATAPRFSTWFNNHTKKVEILAHTQSSELPRIICVGGSSTTYAVDCEYMEELLNGEYMVVNFGTNGANLWNMVCQWVMKFMNEGDIVLQLPEYSAWQLGGVIFRWETFRSFESCYNAFRWFDASYFYDVLTCFGEYLDSRADMDPKTYEDYQSTMAPNGYYNNQGTLNVHVRGSSPDFHSGRSVYLCGEWLYDYMEYYCNYSYSAIEYYGGTPLMSWTPFNYNALSNSPDDPAIDAFQTYLDESLTIPIISNIHDYFYTGEYFFDDDYHLSYESRLGYTEQLAADINAYLADPEAYEK